MHQKSNVIYMHERKKGYALKKAFKAQSLFLYLGCILAAAAVIWWALKL